MLSQTSLFMLLSSLAVRAAPLADTTSQADSGLASLYYQCGGINWTGATACVEGATCYSQNDYYYQCIATENVPSATAPASAAATTTPAKASSFAASRVTSAKIAIQSTPAKASSFAASRVTSAKIAVRSTSQKESSHNRTSKSAITSSSTFKTTSQLAKTSSAAQTVDHNVKKSSYSSAVKQKTSSHAAQQTSSSSEAAAAQTTSSTVSSAKATSSSATASSSASASGSSSSSTSSDLKTVSGGFSGTGKTTRYWDCCLPSYSWPGKSSAVSSPVRACDASGDVLTGTNFQSGCNGGEAYMCNDQVPWAVNDNLAYGFGAASVSGATDETLACSCMKLTFTSTSIQGKEMVIQITNTGGDLGENQFDLAFPGGGVGIFTSGFAKRL
ncbi:unnamed protein product [Ambrosiozyma monospora]|uniref:cellulase n=1 Tax=Ambrosiozyma monospora TaxID=43982 RepID=A0A9W6T7I6_AMBMO|nr:unnamed protein product [Ambrosiozyma monospora]